MGNIAASVLAKLKNKARQQGISLQQLLNYPHLTFSRMFGEGDSIRTP
jgi:hypothetical protein